MKVNVNHKLAVPAWMPLVTEWKQATDRTRLTGTFVA